MLATVIEMTPKDAPVSDAEAAAIIHEARGKFATGKKKCSPAKRNPEERISTAVAAVARFYDSVEPGIRETEIELVCRQLRDKYRQETNPRPEGVEPEQMPFHWAA